MTLIETLQVQHRELQRLIDQIDAELAKRRSSELPRLLASFARLVTAHLALEDAQLYPSLVGAGQEQVSVAARNFAVAMLQIQAGVQQFLARFSGATISLDEFRPAWEQTVKVLAARIRAEETSLYPLYSRATAPPSKAPARL